MIQVPEAFIRSTTEREGAAGARWLAALPELAARLLRRWECVLDGPVMHGGVGVIVPVLHDQCAAVVKVSFPHPGNVAEPDAFVAWGGHGAVRLYAREDACFAMLLERAGAHTLAQLPDTDEIARIAGRLNRRLAVPAPPGLPRLCERATEWDASLCKDAEEFADALPRRVVDAAVATVREIGRDQPEVMVHGDFHPRNVLSAEREPWLAVDPKGYVGDPAYDGGTLLRTLVYALLEEDDLDKAVLRSLDVFAEAAELDRERVRRWAQFHAVDAVFWGRRHEIRRHDSRRHRIDSAGSGPAPHLPEHLAQLLA